MRSARLRSLVFWAMRDLRRRPLETGLLAAALLATIALTVTPLLFTQALTTTGANILQATPSLVIREFNAMGWTPLPAQESVAIARGVTGVTAARARVWGHVGGPLGLLVVIGLDPDHPPSWAGTLPENGEAVIGADIARAAGRLPVLTLIGQQTATFRVVGHFDGHTDLAVKNAVLLHIDTARALLGIPPDYASDVAVEVFNPAEETAILPDLAAAYPRPVRITTRSEISGIHAAGLARRGGLAVVFMVPALLAVCLLVVATVRERLGHRLEIGLLKSLGWTTGDVVALQAMRAASLSVAAIAGGLLVAVTIVYRGGTAWPALFLPQWQALPSHLAFDPLDLALPLLEATGLVILPYVAATIGAALRSAVSAPGDMLERTDV